MLVRTRTLRTLRRLEMSPPSVRGGRESCLWLLAVLVVRPLRLPAQSSIQDALPGPYWTHVGQVPASGADARETDNREDSRGAGAAAPIPPAQKPLHGGLAGSAGSAALASFLPGPHADPHPWAPAAAQGGSATEHNVAPCSRPSLLELAHFLPGLRGAFQGSRGAPAGGSHHPRPSMAPRVAPAHRLPGWTRGPLSSAGDSVWTGAGTRQERLALPVGPEPPQRTARSELMSIRHLTPRLKDTAWGLWMEALCPEAQGSFPSLSPAISRNPHYRASAVVAGADRYSPRSGETAVSATCLRTSRRHRAAGFECLLPGCGFVGTERPAKQPAGPAFLWHGVEEVQGGSRSA
ncbi:uncharacterized protein LOC124970639 [Sciurus carolinensis]|uniref:uncharacterized protein LOC124970639 n=1 Tax=Sciurus carolinensis TaxID=30640 RepID=UPI001FB4E9CE|nr:uncharacterized protein LOC124970639 [Sciurus carolinensis]